MNEPRRLRAPAQDGAIVAEPSLADVGSLLASNRQRLGEAQSTILGIPLAELREQAKQAAVDTAQAYLQQAGEPTPSAESLSLIMAGHQPELFHPGVWIKNFALNGLAQQHNLTPINLIVDNDTAKSTSLHIPAIDPAGNSLPYLQSIPYDEWAGDGPYEERTVRDEKLFAEFPQRVDCALRGLNYTPFLDEFWSEVKQQAKRTRLLGERFAAARRTFERRWGCHNLELPVSLLCQTEPFAVFASHLLTDLPRFHAIYNECVHTYRRRHGLRSRNHPVPDLATEDGWLEAPFWAWRTGQSKRQRLFVKPNGNDLLLRAGTDLWPSLPLGSRLSALSSQHCVDAVLDLQHGGYRIRSRALTNTLFARVFLADLFIHGIGGGKYDEVSDEIIRGFYGMEPPNYMVLSGTLLLPLPGFPVDQKDHGALVQAIRDLYYNPQRYLDGQADDGLKEQETQKLAWIAKQPVTHEERRQRFQTLQTINDGLRPLVAARIDRLREELLHIDNEISGNAVLKRRDYAFCMYPERKLREFCTPFLTTVQMALP